MKNLTVFLGLVFAFAYTAKSQLLVTSDTNTVQLVNNFILTGVTASNVQYTGAPFTLGSFANGSTTNLSLTDGIVMTTGTLDISAGSGISNPVSVFASFLNGFAGDTLLDDLIPGYVTYDASVLEFDLIPIGSILEFQYVFGSEEYPEFVGSSFNDVFGFFITGDNPAGGAYSNENIAIIPGTSLPVAINNVNAVSNPTYYVDNQTLNGQTIVFDGFTTVLTAQISVTPSTPYHLKMAIADAGDGVYDSGIFLKAQSMKSYNPVGIEEHEVSSSNIYPNPVNENSVMTFNTDAPGKINIYISDCLGRNIFESSENSSQTGEHSYSIGKILNDFPSGIYFINIQTSGKSLLQRVVK
jgi:hypothetical protein